MTLGPLAVSISPAKRQPVNGVFSFAMPSMVGLRISCLMRSRSAALTVGVGAKAPMPPVLGPSSQSKMRLWSCAGGSTAMWVPSVRQRMEHSGPAIFSSSTISMPASPIVPFSRKSRTAALASSRLVGTMTPLPAARPLALTTTSKGASSMYFRAAARLSLPLKFLYAAVGMPWRAMKSLAKALEASICEAAFDGPKTAMPFSLRTSTMPSASMTSGPTTTIETFSSWQKATTSAKSGPLTSSTCGMSGALPASLAFTASAAMVPPLPGATYTQLTSTEAAILPAKACSRAPDPSTNTGFWKRAVESAEFRP
mmetsp:Transcript_63382/g.166006  ORF Transcript_63382/g.166006 Transcript_63382/m.166006 type:complete len:312 (-) Transcript_63382:531-1466(-)